MQAKVSDRVEQPQADDPLPSWIPPFVLPDKDDLASFIPPLCVMSAQTDPRTGLRPQSTFYKLDPSQKLSVLLRHTPFVEFPTIDVWEEGDAKFGGTIVDATGGVTRFADDVDGERKVKRRKLDVRAGKKTINGLLCDYGSDKEDDENGREEANVMATLDAYAESDSDEPAADETDYEDESADGGLTPAALLELVRQAQALSAQRTGDGGEDQIDWGDSEDEGPV